MSEVVLLRKALTKKQQALVALAYQSKIVEKRLDHAASLAWLVRLGGK